MADDPFPVFSPSGQMLGNFTSAQGQLPQTLGPEIVSDPGPGFVGLTPGGSFTSGSGLQPLPALPSTFAPSQTSQGNTVTSQGGAGGSSITAPTIAPFQTTPSNAQAGAQPQASNGIQSGSLADYFFRAVIIILGFIFVAIGLNMFKPGIVPVPVPGLRR